jgi:lipid II:glycine glycyltransferase (peptidoglycan interpeptide bridge formation enzyme)
MEIEILKTLPSDAWAEFVAAHPRGNIFQTPDMYEVFNRTKGFEPQLWAALKNGKILVLFPVVAITLRDGLLRRFTTRSVSYGSILCREDEDGREGLKRLLEVYKQEKRKEVLFTELRNLSDLSPIQTTLQEKGFIFRDHLNYLIDLNMPSEMILAKIGPKTRKHIRRALKRNEIVFSEIERKEDIFEFYHLLSQTYKRAQVPLSDISLFKAAFELLRPRKMIRFTMARIEGVPAAASVDLIYKRVMYGWFGAVNRAYGKFTPHEALTWQLFQWGSANGLHVYDFGGAGDPNEEYGVREFKAKFGGKLVGYGRNVCVHAPAMLAVCKQGYNLCRKWL